MSPVPARKTIAPRKAAKKSVSFNSSVTVKECLHKNEFTATERSATWYNQRESFAIKASCRRTMKLMKQGIIDMGGDDYCTRGLEKRVQKPTEGILATVAVLREQYFQNCAGFRDDERLSQVYQQISTKSKITAYATALFDREAVSPQSQQQSQQQLPKFMAPQRATSRNLPTMRIVAQTPAIRCRAA
mmetsp:Transcript_18686/g.53286  ORF Transcript_18686/g.53286 Transcript_18686/m.53286 type:complete len:188 (-) Transcript_18686:302-865(-)|eukprot:CAMPEP_0119551050 /NCGR_PEP_ID=MMETSP1352-20130426/4433_1 /TAXON_ID=265584 /ORGANISM="Stauroneis constricta, Strain CCMP1120" /LENGTH=187 /DNA_ID=CAMNT_0007597057 /DNA_START=93 /DNA_END=656 /DNA_ORIENTATION=-